MVTQEEKSTEEIKNMVKRTSEFYIFLVLLLFTSSILNAELDSQKRLLFLFDKIEINGNVDVFLTKGKRLREATIYADTEIIHSIKTEVLTKTLFIDANNTYNIARRLPFIKLKAERKYPVEIVISIEDIREIRLLGQSNLTAQKLNSEEISIFMASSGKLHIESIASDRLNVIHEGSGDILLKGNVNDEFKVKISENGSLKPKKWLDARIHGTGNLFLHSKPKNLVIDKQGSGSITDILPGSPPLYDLNASEKRFNNN